MKSKLAIVALILASFLTGMELVQAQMALGSGTITSAIVIAILIASSVVFERRAGTRLYQ